MATHHRLQGSQWNQAPQAQVPVQTTCGPTKIHDDRNLGIKKHEFDVYIYMVILEQIESGNVETSSFKLQYDWTPMIINIYKPINYTCNSINLQYMYI